MTTLATLARTYISFLLQTRPMEECQCVGSMGGRELAMMMALALYLDTGGEGAQVLAAEFAVAATRCAKSHRVLFRCFFFCFPQETLRLLQYVQHNTQAAGGFPVLCCDIVRGSGFAPLELLRTARGEFSLKRSPGSPDTAAASSVPKGQIAHQTVPGKILRMAGYPSVGVFS